MYKYHQPIVYPSVYCGNKPVLAITVEPIIPSTSKITSVSPKIVSVSVYEPVPSPDNEAELENLAESSDGHLDEVIHFGSLCSVMIPETFFSAGISTADIVANNPVHQIALGTLYGDETVVTESKSKIYLLNKVDVTIIFDDAP